jgi:hypothetical protein
MLKRLTAKQLKIINAVTLKQLLNLRYKKMKNQKVIIICGFSRGGTNLLWNILQSHPEICSVRYETDTIFRKRDHTFSKVISLLAKTGLLHTKLGMSILDNQFYRYKISNYKHPENRYKFEDVFYTKKEVSKTALCFKSIDLDIDYTTLLLEMYPQLYFIGLSRNGYAVAEGHYRRGVSIDKFANHYQFMADQMKLYKKKVSHFKMVKFEDLIRDPFALSQNLYEYLNCEPTVLEKLRFKSKKVLMSDGIHSQTFGTAGKKYWFDIDSIKKIIKTNVNKNQIEVLSRSQILEFNSIAEDALNYFGYEVIN